MRIKLAGLILLMLSGCSELNIGDTVEVANSGGICGEYLGYDIGHLVRNKSDGVLYQASNIQAIVRVEYCQ